MRTFRLFPFIHCEILQIGIDFDYNSEVKKLPQKFRRSQMESNP